MSRAWAKFAKYKAEDISVNGDAVSALRCGTWVMTAQREQLVRKPQRKMLRCTLGAGRRSKPLPDRSGSSMDSEGSQEETELDDKGLES